MLLRIRTVLWLMFYILKKKKFMHKYLSKISANCWCFAVFFTIMGLLLDSTVFLFGSALLKSCDWFLSSKFLNSIKSRGNQAMDYVYLLKATEIMGCIMLRFQKQLNYLKKISMRVRLALNIKSELLLLIKSF